MGIDLCGGEIAMPQQFLNSTQITGVLQKMTGAGMSQHVRMRSSGNDALSGDPSDSVLYIAYRNALLLLA